MFFTRADSCDRQFSCFSSDPYNQVIQLTVVRRVWKTPYYFCNARGRLHQKVPLTKTLLNQNFPTNLIFFGPNQFKLYDIGKPYSKIYRKSRVWLCQPSLFSFFFYWFQTCYNYWSTHFTLFLRAGMLNNVSTSYFSVWSTYHRVILIIGLQIIVMICINYMFIGHR